MFVPGEVLDIESGKKNGADSLKLTIQMNGETINQTVQLDLEEVKDDLVEIRHLRDDNATVIVVE